MPFIRIIDEDEATGELAKQYALARKRAGKVYNVIKMQSHRAGVLKRSTDLYRTVMYGESGLTRAERELLAVSVSHANQCHY